MKIRCNNCFHEYEESYGLCPNCGFMEGEDYAEVYCLNPGTLIRDGRYTIGETLGFGGFGITYMAWDRQLETKVAIKEYFPSGLVNRTADDASVFLVANKKADEFEYGKRRFLEEARNMAKFEKHHNVVNVFNYFEENNTAYIIMEYLDGMTLSQTLQTYDEPLPVERCVSIAIDICDALESIHKEGILHRDVSPDNIMLCKDGTVKLFDFGAARFSMDTAEDSNVTVIVKPGFAPPEQYDRVNKQDARTDIYALGATMYYALTGVKPEESTDRKIQDGLKAPMELLPEIPKYVSNAIMRAMAVESRYRFESVEEFRKVLKTKTTVASVAAEREKKQRRKILQICAAIVCVLAAAASTLLFWQYKGNSSVLPDGSIELWYCAPEEKADREIAAAAWKSVADYFVAEYTNVTVQIKGIPQEKYAEEIAQAQKNGKLPDIFESTDLPASMLRDTQSLTKLLSGEDNVYLAALGEESNRYPTGLVIPVIYVNTSIGPVREAQSIEKMASACADFDSTLVVDTSDAELYERIYSADLAAYTAGDALDQFLRGESLMYLGTTMDYLAVQEGLMRKGVGTYTVLFPETGSSTYTYGCLWSCSEMDEDQSKIAQAFLKYLNSNLAQDYFHIRNFSVSTCVPATKTAMEAYTQSYVELEGMMDYLLAPYAQ